MIKQISLLEAIKIYFSRNSYQDKGKVIPLTIGDLFICSFLFFLTIPSMVIAIPYQIYKLKKSGGVIKKYRKYYLYYNTTKKGGAKR